MLSAFSPLTSFETPFPVFEGGLAPWDLQDALFQFPQDEPNLPNNVHEPVISNSTGSDEAILNKPDDANGTGSIIDERKHKRKISNRESAKRSRQRKQKHLEDLTRQVNRLEALNRELANRVGSITHFCQLVQRKNEMMESELGFLRQRLWAMHQVLVAREIEQMQYNHMTNVTNELNNFNQNFPLLNL